MNITDIESYKQDISSVLSNNFPWQLLDGKNILVTGATGLLCSFLVDVLMAKEDKKYQIWICGRNVENAKKRFFRFWEQPAFHFLNQDLTEEIASDAHFNYIIHGAGLSFPAAFSSNPVSTIRTTVLGTDNLLKYGLTHELERMVYVSSGEVYGDGEQKAWKEHDSGYVDSLTPRSCYPTSKRTAENLCCCYFSQYGTDVVIVRPSHIYGPTFTPSDNRAYAQFIRNAAQGQDIVLKSDGSQKRGYCYVADCVSAILFALFYGKSGQAYNISDEKNYISVRELAEITAKAGNVKVIFHEPESIEKKGYSSLMSTCLDNSNMKALGWNAKVPLIDGIAKTLEIFKKL